MKTGEVVAKITLYTVAAIVTGGIVYFVLGVGDTVNKQAEVDQKKVNYSPDFERWVNTLRDSEDPEARRVTARSMAESNDPRVDEYLKAALKNKDVVVAAGAYSFFLRKRNEFIQDGEAETSATLVEALHKFGDKKMALSFLNSGDHTLETEARRWAEKNRFTITSQRGLSR